MNISAITSFIEDEHVQMALECGMNELLSKPVKLDLLD